VVVRVLVLSSVELVVEVVGPVLVLVD